MEDLWYATKIFLLTVLVTALLFGVIGGAAVGIVTLTEKKYCETQKRLSPQLEFTWEFWGGCLIHLPDGTWAYASNWLNSNRLELQQP